MRAFIRPAIAITATLIASSATAESKRESIDFTPSSDTQIPTPAAIVAPKAAPIPKMPDIKAPPPPTALVIRSVMVPLSKDSQETSLEAFLANATSEFKRLDKDGNGQLSEKEMQPAPVKMPEGMKIPKGIKMPANIKPPEMPKVEIPKPVMMEPIVPPPIPGQPPKTKP